MEKLHVFENKLFIAEQNREKEIQKKLDNIRRHVRFCVLFFKFDDFATHSATFAKFEYHLKKDVILICKINPTLNIPIYIFSTTN